MINATTLNKVAELLGTTDKNLVFNAVIHTLTLQGIEIDVAVDMVFGEGTYKKLAGEVYNTLRAA